jgi:hypothetical protein
MDCIRRMDQEVMPVLQEIGEEWCRKSPCEPNSLVRPAWTPAATRHPVAA